MDLAELIENRSLILLGGAMGPKAFTDGIAECIATGAMIRSWMAVARICLCIERRGRG